jgi:hypothetical protein
MVAVCGLNNINLFGSYHTVTDEVTDDLSNT